MAAVDVSGLLLDLGGIVTLAVSRPVAATDSDDYGNPMGGSSTALSRDCVVLPLPASTFERMELDYRKRYRVFYCEADLQLGDEVTFDGSEWVLFDVKDYEDLGGIVWALGEAVE